MRVAIVAESFLPNVNGVTNSVLRVLEHLHETGQEAIVIAPGAREGQEEIPDYLGFPIYRVPTVRVPLVDSLPVGVPTTAVDEALRDFKPDIIHLASPFVLGAITMASCPVSCRCSKTRSTELVTPLTLGRKDSATIATRMPP